MNIIDADDRAFLADVRDAVRAAIRDIKINRIEKMLAAMVEAEAALDDKDLQ